MRKSPNARAEPSPVRRIGCPWLALSLSLLSLGVSVARADGAAPAEDAALLANARAAVSVLAARGGRFDSPDLGAAPLARLRSALAPHVLFEVRINPEMRVKVARGEAEPQLTTGAWSYFLARIENESGTTAALQAESPQRTGNPSAARDAWLELRVLDEAALPARLSGRPVEYRVVALRTTAQGRREARFSLHVGQGTQDLGFRNEVDILFLCTPPRP